MGLRERLSQIWDVAGGEQRPDGLDELHVGDAAYDDWDIVGDFGDLATGRAFRQSLAERGVDAVLTSDWPLDEWGPGTSRCAIPPGAGGRPRTCSTRSRASLRRAEQGSIYGERGGSRSRDP